MTNFLKQTIQNFTRSEHGNVLPMVLLTIGIGAIVIVPMVVSTTTHLASAQKATQSLKEQYAVSAGLEDAIWNLTWGDFRSTVLDVTGASTEYSLSQTINGKNVEVSIERVSSTAIAQDSMNSGGTSGGFGWNTSWQTSGDVGVISSGEPYEGSSHFRIGTTGTAGRTVDILGQDEVILRFWAKVSGLQSGDTISLLASSNGTNWATMRTWDDTDSDNTYRFYEVDLSGLSTSSDFWISFEGGLASSGQFYFDDLSISGPDVFEILVSGQRQSVFAEVMAQSGGGGVQIVTWTRNANPTPTPIVSPTATFTATPTATLMPTAAPTPSMVTIDFEGLSAGTIVDSVSSGSGISGGVVTGSVSVFGREPTFPGANTAMIFDATCQGGCSGADSDLNKPELGKILIISEDLDSGDPDDSARSDTWLDFDFSSFDSGTVRVESLDALDTEQANAKVDLYEGGEDGTLLQTIPIPDTGDNGLENVSVGVSGVDFMRVTLDGSGSIDNIVLATEPVGGPTPTPTPSPTPTFTPTPTPASALNSTIDFEGLSAGTIVDSVSSGSGISGDVVSGSIAVYGNEPDIPGTNAAMIFDAMCPGFCSGGDSDLEKPELGKIIIVSEDMDSGDPDDSADYGTYLDFDFSMFGSGSVTIESIDVLDIEQSPSNIELYSGGQNGTLLQTIDLPDTGDNGLATVSVGISGVDFMRITPNGSGAIDNIEITTAP